MNRSYRPTALAISLAIVIVVRLVFAADAPEWPRFRGPEGNPVSTVRLPDTWSKTENVEWKAVIPGRGGYAMKDEESTTVTFRAATRSAPASVVYSPPATPVPRASTPRASSAPCGSVQARRGLQLLRVIGVRTCRVAEGPPDHRAGNRRTRCW